MLQYFIPLQRKAAYNNFRKSYSIKAVLQSYQITDSMKLQKCPKTPSKLEFYWFH
jgi:hypothetical protein